MPALAFVVPTATVVPAGMVLSCCVAIKISGTVPGPAPTLMLWSITEILTPGDTKTAIYLTPIEDVSSSC
jgi:hypothetical protein